MDPSARRFEHCGIVFFVGPRTPYPGIGWFIQMYDHLGTEAGFHESQGAFYDGVEDHPEGAYAWAEASCRRWIDSQLEEKP